MNAQECELTYRKLVAMLEERQLGWVIEQLNAAILVGDIELPEKARSSTIIEEFSAQKKLKYLVDALEQAAVNTVEMEREVTVFFEGEVAFYPDCEDSQASLLINQNYSNKRRQEFATYLGELLNTLKSRISENGSK
jgi:hypothetical protein